MPQKDDSRLLIALGILFIVLISAPYLWAFQSVGHGFQFGGFLINPLDGNSYLAKMYQGWQGNWKFYLPYSAQPGDGGYLFLFYLALGKISKLSGATLQTTFHLARGLGAVILVISLWHFFSKVLTTRRSKWLAFGFALFGSGMGWLAASFGLFTADFWVAEGYPFLSSYANPHFPLGLAILLWILTPEKDEKRKRNKKSRFLHYVLLSGAGLVLALILPFGAVIACLVFWDLMVEVSAFNRKSARIDKLAGLIYQSDSMKNFVLVFLGGLPILIYEVWITQNDPVFSIWNKQNLTVSPTIWDLIISFSPVALLAIPGIYWVWRNKMSPARILILWAGLSLVLLYFPWNLQRRFILGYFIPLAGLAAVGMDHLLAKKRALAMVVICLAILLVVPTNLMIILGGIQAVQAKEQKIILTQNEIDGLRWIESNSHRDALILASPEMGLFIPAYTGRRVLYGHPFETVNAQRMEEIVLNLLRDLGEKKKDAVLLDVSYIFYGTRERKISGENLLPGFKVLFSSGDVQILDLQGPQSFPTDTGQ
jgi:hypothetical protein